MSNSSIDYDLPPELIAQEPCEPRDHARLLVVDRQSGSLRHQRFDDLPALLKPGDLLVLNDTRVVPARLLGKRAKTGGKWEGLFLRELPDGDWEMLCQTRGTLTAGEIIEIDRPFLPSPVRGRGAGGEGAEAAPALRLTARMPGGRWKIKPLLPGSAVELLERFGQVPLPPYIRKGIAKPDDRGRYQTVYAKDPGAVAAPTAGLHFTDRLFAALQERGIPWTFVTLHVGLGTFQPIQVDDYSKHPMHAEWGRLDADAVAAITQCKQRGGRVIAVGTTAVRVLETAARPGPLEPWTGETDLFIHLPYDFKIVDALITNFHLPRTTLLLLVAAFAGTELTRQAYNAAIAGRYRFYSYGDAMLIV